MLGVLPQALRVLAGSVLVVDHAGAWTSAAAESGDDFAPAGWLDDTFHPGARGHHELTLTLLSAIGIADPDSDVCSLDVADSVGASA